VVRGVIAVGRVAWEHCGSSSEWRERAKRRDCEKGCWMAGLETSQWASAVDLDGRGACQHVRERERESSSDEGGMCDAMFGGVKQSAGTRGRTVGRHHHSPVAAGSKAFKAMTGSRDRFPWERNGVCVCGGWWLVVVGDGGGGLPTCPLMLRCDRERSGRGESTGARTGAEWR
jgi:hypothetical protein